MKNTKLSILLSKCDATAPIPDDLTAWLDSPFVGNEIITDCEETSLNSDDEYRAALKNVQEMGGFVFGFEKRMNIYNCLKRCQSRYLIVNSLQHAANKLQGERNGGCFAF